MDMKRFFLYAIAIAALALAGCGGNGGRTAGPVDPGCRQIHDVRQIRVRQTARSDRSRAPHPWS